MRRSKRGSAAPKTVTVLGLDPGLSFTGYAIAVVNVARPQIVSVKEVGVIVTERQKSRQVRMTSDGFDRARIQARAIQALIEGHAVDMIAMEMAAATLHIKPTFSFGVLIGIAACLEPPVVQVLPREVKAAVGDKNAKKRDVIAWALMKSIGGTAEWPTSGRANGLALTWRGRSVTRAAEHPADALAAVEAALSTDQFRLAAKLGI